MVAGEKFMNVSNGRVSPPDYRIIFNWDGTPHGYLDVPYTSEQLLDIIYAPIENTQVDALFWCLGTHEASWPSESLSRVGDSEGRRYMSVTGMRRSEGVRVLWREGKDFYDRLVARGHELGIHVYASIRMNDNHFWSDESMHALPLKPEDMVDTSRPGLTQIRKDHPEWTLGIGNGPTWAATSWNIANLGVREHLLQYISEACFLTDWDGVELDWQRHAFHLPEQDAYRLRYTLTDLQRAVREVSDGITRKREVPFHVAVRIGASVETCRRIGYDVEGWIRDGLCDIIATNANSGTDPGVEIERYLDFAKDSGIKFYPGFDSHGETGQGRLISSKDWLGSWYRGLAQGFHRRNAAGIHIFNWHATVDSHRSLLTTIGDPDTLKRTDKIYTVLKRHIRAQGEGYYGAERDDRLLGEVPVSLYQTDSNGGPVFHISMHDDVASAGEAGWLGSVSLQVEINHLSPIDVLDVWLDGAELGIPKRTNAAVIDSENPADVSESGWLIWYLDEDQLGIGLHDVRICLVERDSRIRIPPIVENVEIHVRYV